MLAISGILPIKNGEHWIPSNLPKILKTLGLDDELIVVDDGSSDNTYSLLSEQAFKDQRIQILRTTGVGLVEALNLAISESENSWLARFDIDDTYPENRVLKQREEIDSNTSVIFTDYRIRLNGGTNLGFVPSPITHLAIKLSLLRSQRTAHPSALINKEKLLKVGGYLQSEFPAEDLGLWTRLSLIGRLKSVPINGLDYNFHSGSITKMNQDLISSKRDAILKVYAKSLEMHEILAALEETRSSYKEVSLGNHRLILHLWDFLHPISRQSLGEKKIKSIQRLLSSSLLNPRGSIAAGNLFVFKTLRSFLK
jgi:glycosyltransferase involved in cell wall biosynthesis